jgi:hypothetical protein
MRKQRDYVECKSNAIVNAKATRTIRESTARVNAKATQERMQKESESKAM